MRRPIQRIGLNKYHDNYIHPDTLPSADDCLDQLPMFSQVGRGPAGDSYKVAIDSDNESSTYLAGYTFHSTLREWTKDWVSENINGGKLDYAITIHEDNTFDITFTYTRADRFEWEFTTPKIPYLIDENDKFISYEALGKILSTSTGTLHWLIDNKESIEDSVNDTGIRGTEHDVLDWIDSVNEENLEDINQKFFDWEEREDEKIDTIYDKLINLEEKLNTTIESMQERIQELWDAVFSSEPDDNPDNPDDEPEPDDNPDNPDGDEPDDGDDDPGETGDPDD